MFAAVKAFLNFALGVDLIVLDIWYRSDSARRLNYLQSAVSLLSQHCWLRVLIMPDNLHSDQSC